MASTYVLYRGGESLSFQVKGRSPTKALRELCLAAGLELASQNGRYGVLADGTRVAALTQDWSRRRLDLNERTTRSLRGEG